MAIDCAVTPDFGKRRLLSGEAIGIQSFPPRTFEPKIEQRVARSGPNLRGVDDRVVEIAVREREDVDRIEGGPRGVDWQPPRDDCIR